MVPTASEWTVVFSGQSHAWGSYGYDAKEDLVRLKVTPVAAEPTERLAFTFDDPTEAGVTLSLRWEKLRVPIPLEVDTKAVVAQSLRDQLRGLHQFFPESWSAAAAWCARQGTNLDEALTWADRSLALRETFTGLRVKAALLEKQGKATEAEALRVRALARATEAEVNQLGYALLGQQKMDEAIALFQRNVKDHPDSWNTYDSLAEAYALKGDKAQAVANYRRAYDLVKQPDQRTRIQGELDKLK
jgi:tetratricopeptide (TPR) repeat protein